jgi:hypothetical protein
MGQNISIPILLPHDDYCFNAYTVVMLSVTAIALMANGYTLYLIVWVSPAYLKGYRYLLLQSVVIFNYV